MTQLENILDLVRTVNEVYFITAPTRTRAAFLLVDDIVELTLKSYLQTFAEGEQAKCLNEFNSKSMIPKDKQKALQSYFESHLTIDLLATEWGQTKADIEDVLKKYRHLRSLKLHGEESRTSFDDIVKETKKCVTNTDTLTLLDILLGRHKLRNKLYHNQNALSWAIDNKQCLGALCDLYKIIDELFATECPPILSQEKHFITRSQMRVIHLLTKISGNETYEEIYRNGVLHSATVSKHKLKKDIDKLNYSLLHTDSNNFIDTFYDYLLAFIAKEKEDLSKQGCDLNDVAKLTASQRNRVRRMEFLAKEAEHFRILTEA